MEICPICRKETKDIRHVGVECNYDVEEIIPDINKKKFYYPISMDKTYWGTTKIYYSGTVGKLEIIPKENITEIVRKQILLPEDEQTQRFIEIPVFQILCCKSCRADFLEVFKQWRQGQFCKQLKDKCEIDNIYDEEN